MSDLRDGGDGTGIAVHPKRWGEEHWIVNKTYCGKKLILRAGHRCSLHRHRIKDETFYLLTGRVLMEVDGDERVMHPGDKQDIAPGQLHRFTGLVESEIMEFSTHHRDDDSFREEPSERMDGVAFRALQRRLAADDAIPARD